MLKCCNATDTIVKKRNISMMENLRKFGLKFYDLPTMIWNVSFFLKFSALNIDPRHKESTGILDWIWLAFIMGCYYYVYLVSMIWFVFWRCRETGDVFTAIVVFSLGVSSEISATKLIYMLFHRNSLRKIVSDYLECDSQVVAGTRFADNLKPTLKSVKKRAMIVWNVIVWNGIIYFVIPLLRPGRRMPADNFEFYGVEDMRSHPVYDIVFAINTIAIFVTCYPAANITAFFIIVTGYTEAQMLALSEELTNLWDDANIQYDRTFLQNSSGLVVEHNQTQKHKEKFINDYIRKKLIDIVNTHVTNINLLKEVEGVFRGSIAIEFMLLIMGLIAELLGGLEKTYIQLPFAMMFVVADCFTGQRIIDAGRVFDRAVYNCHWEYFNVSNRKIVRLMLQNSQKTMRLSAGGVTNLSLESLMKVIRMIYSAYTTLRTTMK